MAEKIAEFVRSVLKREGFSYEQSGEQFLLLASYGEHKWKMAVICDGINQVTCLSAFPWKFDDAAVFRIEKEIGEWNRRQCVGCFVTQLPSRHIAYRFGVPLLDEYSYEEYIRYAMLSSAAVVNAYWKSAYLLASSDFGDSLLKTRMSGR